MRNFIRTTADRVRAVWRRIPVALRSGWITAWVTFFGTIATILTGLLPRLAEAVSSGNFEPFFDALSLGYAAAVSAATAFVAGVVNAIWRWVRPLAESYQTAPPPE